MRDLETHPYSEDEKRVAKFFADKGIGGGDDPIGFILSSYEYIIAERNELRVEKEQLWTELTHSSQEL